MFAWSTLDIILIAVLAGASGGPYSEVVFLYVLTTVFFAASYPRPAQVALFGLTCACYLALCLGWDPIPPPAIMLSRLGTLAIVWFMAAFLAREREQELVGRVRSAALAEHRADLLAAVAQTSSATAVLDPEQVMEGVVESLRGLGFDYAAVCLLEQGGASYRARHSRGLPEALTISDHPTTRGVVGQVLAHNTTISVSDTAAILHGFPELRSLGVRSVIGGPIRVGSEVVAVLVAAKRTRASLARADSEVFEILASQVGRSLENAHRFEAERDLATEASATSLRDELTGIGNRRRANALLDALQPGDGVALVDLDHFKDVNDTLGHLAGDQVLVEVAAYLRSAVRDVDDVARFGGEEFLVILRGSAEDPVLAVERLLAGWRTRHPVTSFSAGVAVHGSDRTPIVTVSQADAALYTAKHSGRDRVCAYSPSTEPDGRDRSPVEALSRPVARSIG
jgi:diguanylate cyclase (GGDEF)-like protein